MKNLIEELRQRNLTVKRETLDCRTCGNPSCDACEWIQIGGTFPRDKTWVIEKTGWAKDTKIISNEKEC